MGMHFCRAFLYIAAQAPVTNFKLLVNSDAFQAPLVVGAGNWLEHSVHELQQQISIVKDDACL